MWWLIGDVAHWRCGGAMELWWLIGDVVAHWSCGGSLEMWWLIGAVVAHWRCGGSTPFTLKKLEIERRSFSASFEHLSTMKHQFTIDLIYLKSS